ncbi:MAG: acyltransferase [Acidobacteriaceae bacterium]|nr:acyltransferase [Acidobacteriaceae bacterium]
MQLLRAFAALAIVASHASTPEHDLSLGAIRVDVFFILSGFVMIMANRRIYENTIPVYTFLRRRFIRIVPLYWLFLTVLVIAYRHKHIPAGYILSSYFFIPYRGDGPTAIHYLPLLIVGWTLSFEVFFYLGLALCIWLRKSPLWLAIPFCLLALYGLHNPEPTHAILSLFNYHLVEFLAGIVFAYLYRRGILFPQSVAAFTLIGTLVLLYSKRYRHEFTNSPDLMPLAALLVLSVLSFEPQIRKYTPRVIEQLADISYPLYLIHQQFVIFPLQGFLKRLHRTPTTLAGFLFELFIIYAISITAAILIHRWIEIPILARFGVRIGGHKPSPVPVAATA